MEQTSLLLLVEAILRVILGLRFLTSGISNVRRWPHATQTAGILFPQSAYLFGFIATALMVLGGAGLTMGFQTPLAAAMLVIFLLPTFRLHQYWLRKLPGMGIIVRGGLHHAEAEKHFLIFERQAIHSHETGWQNNLVLLAASLFFTLRGSVAFGLDNWLGDWVIWFF